MTPSTFSRNDRASNIGLFGRSDWADEGIGCWWGRLFSIPDQGQSCSSREVWMEYNRGACCAEFMEVETKSGFSLASP
jgi:hypothetical protein